LAVHCEVVAIAAELGVHVAVTAVMVGAVMVTEAEPDFAVFAALVAVMVTGLVVGMAAGAV